MDGSVQKGLHHIVRHLNSQGKGEKVTVVDLWQLHLPDQWITNFLTNRTLGKSTRAISRGAPQGCVISPLFFSLFTDCTSKDPNVKLPWFSGGDHSHGATSESKNLIKEVWRDEQSK